MPGNPFPRLLRECTDQQADHPFSYRRERRNVAYAAFQADLCRALFCWYCLCFLSRRKDPYRGGKTVGSLYPYASRNARLVGDGCRGCFQRWSCCSEHQRSYFLLSRFPGCLQLSYCAPAIPVGRSLYSPHDYWNGPFGDRYRYPSGGGDRTLFLDWPRDRNRYRWDQCYREPRPYLPRSQSGRRETAAWRKRECDTRCAASSGVGRSCDCLFQCHIVRAYSYWRRSYDLWQRLDHGRCSGGSNREPADN